MNVSTPFIHRPVATTLLTIAVALAGIIGFLVLPIAALPQIDYPTISVQASLPGASPEIMASSVATPLERQFGRIAGVTEMSSSSYLGSTSIALQFDLNRNIDGAARDVQAAINAARSYLPANLPNNPTYQKVNPADDPILVIALTSRIYDTGRLYDAASTIMQQKLSQVSGVGQVYVGGSSLPAVRVEINPTQLNSYGLGLQDVKNMLSQQNANVPKGQIWDDDTTADILANDQLLKAEYYKPLIVGYHKGAAIKLSDVAEVRDSTENIRTAGYFNGRPCVTMQVYRQPNANIIDTIDHVRQALPALQASIPAGIEVTVTSDRSARIRPSIREAERSLLVSIGLVVLVVFVFLRSPRATLIPSVAVPVSLLGTFGVMYLFGYSIDNVSLMALTICTGFVVDDAIVVIENITRYFEQGMRPFEAALRGAQEIGFTVLSMTLSLVAVFIPILLMAGIVGRVFREFAVTLSVSILVSLLCFADDDPDDVRPSAEAERGRDARANLPHHRKGLRFYAARVRSRPEVGAGARAVHAGNPADHDCREHLSSGDRAQGLFSAGRHRQTDRGRSRFSGYFVSGHESAELSVRQPHQDRSRGGGRFGLYGRKRPGEHRPRQCDADAVRRPATVRQPGD